MKATASLAAVGLLGAAAIACGSREGRPGAPAADSPAPAAPSGHRIHRYVSPAGDDAERGTRKRPWRTLAHAAARARPGVTVHVGKGEYAGPLRIARGGTARRPVRFVSQGRWQARIVARDGGPLSVVEIAGDHVSFAGFEVTGGREAAVGIEAEGSHGVVAGNRVRDVAAPCAAGAGIVVGGDDYRNHDVLVTGNVVARIGSGPRDGTCRLMHGIYAAVPRVTVVNNIVDRAVGDGITSWHAARELTIANNLATRNGGAGILVGSGDSGASRAGNTRTLISNNIVTRNALYGITESSDGSHPVGPGNQYLSNLAHGNGEGGVGGLSAGEVAAGNLDVDPLLAGAPPYRPRRASPAVDAGTCAGAATLDLEGRVRPQGRGVDIGPYERRARRGRCRS